MPETLKPPTRAQLHDAAATLARALHSDLDRHVQGLQRGALWVSLSALERITDTRQSRGLAARPSHRQMKAAAGTLRRLAAQGVGAHLSHNDLPSLTEAAGVFDRLQRETIDNGTAGDPRGMGRTWA